MQLIIHVLKFYERKLKAIVRKTWISDLLFWLCGQWLSELLLCVCVGLCTCVYVLPLEVSVDVSVCCSPAYFLRQGLTELETRWLASLPVLLFLPSGAELQVCATLPGLLHGSLGHKYFFHWKICSDLVRTSYIRLLAILISHLINISWYLIP